MVLAGIHDESEESSSDTSGTHSSRGGNERERDSATRRSTSLSSAVGGAESTIYVMANYWGLPTYTVQQTRTVDSGLRVEGKLVHEEVEDARRPKHTTHYIPIEWLKLLQAITSGQQFKHDEHLYRLLTRIGIPYVDVTLNDSKVCYHYLLDVLSLSSSTSREGRDVGSQVFNTSLSVQLSSNSGVNTTPNGTVIPPHPPTPTQGSNSLQRNTEYSKANTGNSVQSFNSGSQGTSSASFNLPSFNQSGGLNMFGGAPGTPSAPGGPTTPAGELYDPHVHQPVQHRGLPTLFREHLVDHEPVKKCLLRSFAKFSSPVTENQGIAYIADSWFHALLKMMPFLYWACQAYAHSVQNCIDLAKQLQNGYDAKTDEVRGDLALRMLTDHCCKLNDASKDPSQQIFLLILILCKVLTRGTQTEITERTLFMNTMFGYLGDGNKFNIVDVTEFLLSGDWIHYLDAGLAKVTKGTMKRFKESMFLPNQTTTFNTSGQQLSSILDGVKVWKEQFLTTFVALENVYEFLTSKDDDSCSIM